MARLNQLVANSATNNINPPIYPTCEIAQHDGAMLLIVEVVKGIRKPYMSNQGIITVKSGSDKRRVINPEEIQRMLQASRLLHGDEVPVTGATIQVIDLDYFDRFLKKEFNSSSDELPLEKILENMNLAKDGVPNTAATLLFAKQPQFKLPAFITKAVAYPGSDVDIENYLDSRDIMGKLADVYAEMVSFILSNLRHEQNGQSINSLGIPAVPRIVLEELIANALIHRDYFISAPIRVFVFCNRIEIINPGHLPNNLTIEHIKNGNSNMRNPILASFATKLLPYRGIGSGIKRALAAYPKIKLEDNREENWFKATITL